MTPWYLLQIVTFLSSSLSLVAKFTCAATRECKFRLITRVGSRLTRHFPWILELPLSAERSVWKPVISLFGTEPLFSFDLTDWLSQHKYCGQRGLSLCKTKPTKCCFNKKLLASDVSETHLIDQRHLSCYLVQAGDSLQTLWEWEQTVFAYRERRACQAASISA